MWTIEYHRSISYSQELIRKVSSFTLDLPFWGWVFAMCFFQHWSTARESSRGPEFEARLSFAVRPVSNPETTRHGDACLERWRWEGQVFKASLSSVVSLRPAWIAQDPETNQKWRTTTSTNNNFYLHYCCKSFLTNSFPRVDELCRIHGCLNLHTG